MEIALDGGMGMVRYQTQPHSHPWTYAYHSFQMPTFGQLACDVNITDLLSNALECFAYDTCSAKAYLRGSNLFRLLILGV